MWRKGDLTGFEDAALPMLKIMCREISRQKKRLGGDFAVAYALATRESFVGACDNRRIIKGKQEGKLSGRLQRKFQGIFVSEKMTVIQKQS